MRVGNIRQHLQYMHTGTTDANPNLYIGEIKQPLNKEMAQHRIGGQILKVNAQQSSYTLRKRDILSGTERYTFWTETSTGEQVMTEAIYVKMESPSPNNSGTVCLDTFHGVRIRVLVLPVCI